MSKEKSLLYEQQRYPIIKERLEENNKEVIRLYEVAWKSWDRDPENHDGAPSGIMEMYEELIRNYKRNESSPYFARIIFEEENGEITDAYIGKIGFVDLKDTKLLDWRSPICDLYYNSALGNTQYEVPMDNEIVKGKLSLKRQIKIENNVVKDIFDFEDTVSSDDFLKPYLTESADNRLKNIVSTIQKEQNEIIRLPLYTNTIVQGVAGSGKTTVALHRLSYLMYNYRKVIKPKQFMIISPNQVFMSYISSLLVDLDADQAYSYSLEGIFNEYTKIKYPILQKHQQYERLADRKINTDYLKFKSSKEFINIIDRYLENLKKKIFMQDLIIDGIKILDKKEMYQYYEAVKMKKLVNTFDAWVKKIVYEMQINTDLIQKIEDHLKEQEIPFGKRLDILRILQRKGLSKYLRKYLPKITPIKLYKNLIKNIEKYTDYQWCKTLKLETLNNLNNKVISYEDMFPLIYIKSQLEDIREYDKIHQVFIDEAQDISYFGYYILREIFPNAYFSIFGDLAQGLYAYQAIDEWKEVAEIIHDSRYLPLNKSYRTSIEIMQEANKTLVKLSMPEANNVIRHGEPVERREGSAREIIKEEIKELRDLGLKTIAIITKDKQELSKASNLLSDFELKIIDEDNSNFDDEEVVLLTVQTSKGLEFDGVIIFNELSYNEENKLDLKQLFVAKTRALHKLFINR